MKSYPSAVRPTSLALLGAWSAVAVSIYASVLLVPIARADVEISDGSARALYHFENNASDTTANAYHGTVNSTSFATGKFGQGVQFGGSPQYVSLPHNATVYGNGSSSADWSISVWVKFATSTNGQTIIADDDGGGSNPKWIFSYGVEQAGHLDFTEGSGGNYVDLGSYTPDTTAFHNFILTYRGATSRYNLYDNGTQIANVTGGTQTSPTSDITVGRAEGSFYFNGAEDDLALFTNVLSTSTIQSVDNFGSGVEICVTSGCIY